MVAPSPGRAGQRPAIQVLAVLVLLGVPTHAATAREASVTHHVVTYFVDKNVDGHIVTEWRILDPATSRDTLFGTFNARGVFWDTTETNVDFVWGEQLFKVRWETGAQPWPIVSMPSYDVVDWWFNPDSLCWQAAVRGGVPRNWGRGEPPYTRCHSELWQSGREGDAWRIVAADTADCGGCYFCETWRLRDSTMIRRRAAIGLGQLQGAMTIDAWGGTPEAIPPPRGESATSSNWFLIPCRSIPGRGLAFRIGRRLGGVKSFIAPIYLVDHAKGTQQLLETPATHRDQELWPMGMEEHEGFLLVSGIRTYLFDLRTGAQILSQPTWIARQAVWIKAPAPPSVDSLGLRRLRDRFR